MATKNLSNSSNLITDNTDLKNISTQNLENQLLFENSSSRKKTFVSPNIIIQFYDGFRNMNTTICSYINPIITY